MGYRWNRLDEPIFMAGSKPMRTEFGICQRLESCDRYLYRPLPIDLDTIPAGCEAKHCLSKERGMKFAGTSFYGMACHSAGCCPETL